MKIKYAHTNIVSSNWKELAKFYQDVLGCEMVLPVRTISDPFLSEGTGVENAELHGVHLRLPGYGLNAPNLEIFEYSEMENNLPPAANRKGLAHLAFHVDDIQTITTNVLENGGSMLGNVTETDLPGVGHLKFVYLTDPEGNILEILNWS